MQLSTAQALSNEQACLLARCYELILSWSAPEKVDATSEPSFVELRTGKDSTADTLSVATAHRQAIACSEASATAS